MIGSPAQHSGTPTNPLLLGPKGFVIRGREKLVGWFAFSTGGVGFTGNKPTAIDRGIVKSEVLVRGCRTAQGGIGGGLEHGSFLDRLIISSGFEHQYFDAGLGKHIGSLTTSRSRPDNDDIVFRGRFPIQQQGHEETKPLRGRAVKDAYGKCDESRSRSR